MAFTRSRLKEILQDDSKTPAEKADLIMDEHVAVVDPLKTERDGLKEQAKELPELQKQVEKLTADAKKFDEERKSFTEYKSKVEKDAERAKLESAFRDLLADEKISGGKTRHDAIVRVTDFSGMKLGEDGKLENESEIRKAINTDWGAFKATVTEKGAVVEKPPMTGKATKTKEEILSMKDTRQRQQAIAENHELFGF